jgi:hypothetical protein
MVLSRWLERVSVHLVLGSVVVAWTCQVAAAAPQEPAEVATEAESPLGSTATLEEVAPQTSASTEPTRDAALAAEDEQAKPLVIHPAAEPGLPMRYRMWPSLDSLKPGRAEVHFFRALGMAQAIDPATQAKVTSYLDQELTPQILNEIRQFLAQNDQLLAEVRRMALCEEQVLDLRIRDLSGIDAYSLPLSEVQAARGLARLIQLQLLVKIQDGDFAGAMEAWQMGFRLAALVGNGETLIQHLVGNAIAAVMLEAVEQAIVRPDCPNLYWALASLPRPLNDIRKGIATESQFATRVLPSIDEAGKGVLTPEQWRDRLLGDLGRLQQLGGGQEAGGASVFSRSLFLSLLVHSESEMRQRLLSRGWTEAQVEKMSVYEKACVDAVEEIQYWRDRLFSPLLLPDAQAGPILAERQEEMNRWLQVNRSRSLGAVAVSLLFPPVMAAHTSHLSVEYRVNRWMTVEALRMQAAQADGQLPDNLKSLTEVPAPDDPFASQPFEYHVERSAEKQTVTLSGKAPSNYPEKLRTLQLVLPAPTPKSETK